MVSSRKSRILALSAILLTVVFIFITSHNSSSSIIPNTNSYSSNTPPQKVETTTKLGGIDETAIKNHEAELKQKIKESQEKVKDKTPAELQKEQEQQQKQKQKSNLSGSAGGSVSGKAAKAPEDSKSGAGSPAAVAGDGSKAAAAGDEDDDGFNAAEEFQSIIRLSPVVIFSKTYCGFSKALKNLLSAEYEINPPPTIVELDKHKNGRKLQDYIATKSGRKTVPNIFIGGVSRGGSDEMRKLHEEGKLLNNLNQWGNKNIKVTKINAPSNS